MGEEIEVHTNTIEGLWAELDSHIHAARGWGAAYVSDISEQSIPALFKPSICYLVSTK